MDPKVIAVIIGILAVVAGFVYYQRKKNTQTDPKGLLSADATSDASRVGTTSETQTNNPSTTGQEGPGWVPPENFIRGTGTPSGAEGEVSYSMRIVMKMYAGDNGILIGTPTTINATTAKFLRAFVRGAKLRIQSMKGKQGEDIPFDKVYTLAETLAWHPEPGNLSNRLQLLERISDPSAPTFIPQEVDAVLKVYE